MARRRGTCDADADADAEADAPYEMKRKINGYCVISALSVFHLSMLPGAAKPRTRSRSTL